MKHYKVVNKAICSFTVLVVVYLLIEPITPSVVANVVVAVGAGAITYLVLQTIALGPVGPLVVRQNLARISLINRLSEPPFLVRIQSDPKVEHGIILEFENRGISREQWDDKRSNIEAALNLFIIKISDGKNRRRVVVHAVPASCGLPDCIHWQNSYLLRDDFTLLLGQGLTKPTTIDISVVPHVLIGGATGSGKSILLRLLLIQCLYKGAIVYLADFKGGMDYTHIQHRSFHLTTTMEAFTAILEEYISELETRKEILLRAGCSNLKEYNKQNPLHQHRRIIIACDEIAEVLDKTGLGRDERDAIDKIIGFLSTIARQGRAVGIHLVLATQRPDANILPGQIKNNIDCRVCGRADLTLSQIILDNGDAHDTIPKDAQGRFLMNDGTVFQGYWYDSKSIIE